MDKITHVGSIGKLLGVQMDKGEMLFNLVRLVQDEVITLDDLEEFSDDVREKVAFMVQRRW